MKALLTFLLVAVVWDSEASTSQRLPTLPCREDDYSPNHSAAAAKEIPVNTEIKGLVLCPKVPDYYKVTVLPSPTRQRVPFYVDLCWGLNYWDFNTNLGLNVYDESRNVYNAINNYFTPYTSCDSAGITLDNSSLPLTMYIWVGNFSGRVGGQFVESQRSLYSLKVDTINDRCPLDQFGRNYGVSAYSNYGSYNVKTCFGSDRVFSFTVLNGERIDVQVMFPRSNQLASLCFNNQCTGGTQAIYATQADIDITLLVTPPPLSSASGLEWERLAWTNNLGVNINVTLSVLNSDRAGTDTSIVVRKGCVPDGLNNNVGFGVAVPLLDGVIRSATLCDLEFDWYSVTLVAANTVTITLNVTDARVSPLGFDVLTCAVSCTLLYNSRTDKEMNRVSFNGGAASIYYVRVRNYLTGFTSYNNYQLLLTLGGVACPDDGLNNNNPNTPYKTVFFGTLPQPQSVNGTACTGATDYFTFQYNTTVNNPDFIAELMWDVSLGQVGFLVVSPGGQNFYRNASNDDGYRRIKFQAPGSNPTVTVIVDHFGGSPIPYTVRGSFRSCPPAGYGDQFDNNGAGNSKFIGQANLNSLPLLSTGSYNLIGCSGDSNSDFFRVQKNFPDEVITVSIDFRVETDFDLFLFDSSEETISAPLRFDYSRPVDFSTWVATYEQVLVPNYTDVAYIGVYLSTASAAGDYTLTVNRRRGYSYYLSTLTTGQPTTAVPTTAAPTTGVPTTGTPAVVTTGPSTNGQVSSKSGEDHGGSGVIIGIVVGVVGGVLLIAALVAVVLWMRRREPQEEEEEGEDMAISPGQSYGGTNGTNESRSSSRPPPNHDQVLGTGTGWSINYSDLKMIMPPLGRGAFGVVYKAEYHGTLVAVKTYVGDDPFGETFEDWSREISNLATLHHVRTLSLHPP